MKELRNQKMKQNKSKQTKKAAVYIRDVGPSQTVESFLKAAFEEYERHIRSERAKLAKKKQSKIRDAAR
jgi:hypothetical protein